MLLISRLINRRLVSGVLVQKMAANDAAAVSAVAPGADEVGLTPDVSGRYKHLVWLDLEMSGLNLETDVIMEIGCLVTNKNLDPVDQGINIVIQQPDNVLDNMNDWCQKQHGTSGLTEACRASQVSIKEAELRVLSYVSGHVAAGRCPLAGNSVHEDRRFLLKYMPRLMDHLHYRIVDVSSLKELCRRWYPKEFGGAPPKSNLHRSIDDVKESIAELKYYRNSIFR